MPRPKKTNSASPVTIHQHTDAARVNIPEATQTKAELPKAKRPVYRYNPHLSPKLRFDDTGAWDKVKAIIDKAISGQVLTSDEAEILRAVAQQGSQPWLEWANKQETEAKGGFSVDDVVLHVHERVSAKAIIASVQREETEQQDDFFVRPKLHRDQALQYYKHNVDWSNRLILGDSLQVMSSLANRENLAGKVQMIYIDPPYGIKFSSNWQNELGKREIKDKEEDLSREPEMIKAYRDTWQLGVHSYLTYLKQRLILARELLNETGSVFVQISDENLHRIRTIMDEVFSLSNCVSIITLKKTAYQASEHLGNVTDYLVWFAKDIKKLMTRQVYMSKEDIESANLYKYTVLTNGERRLLSEQDSDFLRSRRYRLISSISQGASSTDQSFVFEGKTFRPPTNAHWKTNLEGMERMAKADRFTVSGTSLAWFGYISDFPVSPINNIWTDTMTGSFTDPKLYTVQTNTKIVERCILLSTKPGDPVLDPTCGSGTTAYVAEQWGRRWITLDSSRVSLSIARQRLLTATFESFKTKDPTAGVDPSAPQNPAHGFYYKTVPHITLKSIAQNRNLDPIFAKHDPLLSIALETLNSALKGSDSIRPHLISKLKSKILNYGARAVTNADLRRWLLPGTNSSLLSFGTASQRKRLIESIPAGPGWKDWEVPFDTDPDWPQSLQDALTSFRNAWTAKMDEVNACITASAYQEELVNEPIKVPEITRVSGPFSVEGVRPEELALGEDGKLFDPTRNEFDELGAANADGYIDLMINYLRKDGVTFLGNRRAEFASLEKEAGKSFHARGTWKGREDLGPTVAVVFGPQYGPINAYLAVEAIEAAGGLKEITDLIIAGFSFDAAAQQMAKEKDNPTLRIHLAHIRPDVSPGMQGLLKETPNSQLFTVFGQPDIKVLPAGDGEYKVEMNGVCIYNPLTGEISDSTNTKVAAWFLDADYDGSCFCFSQAFFPDKSAWDKIAKALNSSVPESAFQHFTTSWPFKPGKHKRIAVKVIDPRGNEVMAIKTLTT